ncbi:MAG: hypothetical protein KKF33_13545 [Alphaproteobacteria bacterium]|nr:hypothetical protein [Alphaproteobacteria bacterium]
MSGSAGEPTAIFIEMLPDLASRLKRIRNYDTLVQQISDDTYAPLGSALSDVEWYSLCAVVKTSSNILAFCQLIEARNIIASEVTLRSQLDTAMRLFGLSLVDDIEAAGTMLMSGQNYSALCHGGNPKLPLRDWYLRDQLSLRYPWLKQTYQDACESVHLTADAIKRKLKFLNGRIFFNLSGLDHQSVEEASYYHLADTFFISLEMTVELLREFLATRPQPTERAALMLG